MQTKSKVSTTVKVETDKIKQKGGKVIQNNTWKQTTINKSKPNQIKTKLQAKTIQNQPNQTKQRKNKNKPETT